jgi:hypothetical protein
MPARSNVQAATGVYQQKMSGRGSLPDVVYKEENRFQIVSGPERGRKAVSCGKNRIAVGDSISNKTRYFLSSESPNSWGAFEFTWRQ